MKIITADILKERYGHPVVIISAAGFEDRCIGIIRHIKNAGSKVHLSIIIDYDDNELNEPMRSELINTSKSLSPIIVIPIRETEKIKQIVTNIHRPHQIVVDITGMCHPLMFEVLTALELCDVKYDVVYTEAAAYSPDKAFFEKLLTGENEMEGAFSNYLDFEQTESVYSSNCDVVQYQNFVGNPEPGRPGCLLTFMTFKRSRLQVILQEMDFDKKYFIVSEPEREDLKWRKEMMEIANWDIIEKNNNDVFTLSTLNLEGVVNFLNKQTYDNGLFAQYNIYLAPLGSKIQTFGCYLFWKKHPEVSIVFSQPKSYYKEAYSSGIGESFLSVHEKFYNL